MVHDQLHRGPLGECLIGPDDEVEPVLRLDAAHIEPGIYRSISPPTLLHSRSLGHLLLLSIKRGSPVIHPHSYSRTPTHPAPSRPLPSRRSGSGADSGLAPGCGASGR